MPKCQYNHIEAGGYVSDCGHEVAFAPGQQLAPYCSWWGRPVADLVDNFLAEGWETEVNL